MTEQNYPWLETYPPKPDWHMEISPGLMSDVFDKTAARLPDSQAFEFLGKTYDWATLHAAVNKFAAGLQAHGVTKGTKVGLFLPNCPLSLIAYYGILKTGGTVVNFNPLYARDELAAQIEDSETDIMVTLDLAMLMDKMEEMLSDTRLSTLIVGTFTDYLPFPKNILFPVLKPKDQRWVIKSETARRIVFLKDFLKNDGQVKPAPIDPLEDVAVLQYTGGTTGTPKAAMLTHMNIYTNAVQAYASFPDPQGHEKMLAVLPFFHVFAMTVCLNMAVLAGMEIITIPRFDLNDTLDIIQKKKPNYMCGVPAIFSAINNHQKLKIFDLSSLDFCISGGAPLPVEVKKKFEAKTGCTVVEGYGLSESSPVATVNPPFGENVAGSIGLPLPQTIIEIIDPDDKITPVALGERGEVCIRGPQVMKG
ncbi:MAG: AMP-binding protein, partial [Alphaproteobacteria bacterium]|nr:AMP-binding protein [Alphaproteobacteria bacterium]